MSLRFIFFFTDTPPTEIYTLSLHDALPILGEVLVSASTWRRVRDGFEAEGAGALEVKGRGQPVDRKSTRLNSSHRTISYAVFCLKKKKKNTKRSRMLIKNDGTY